VVNKPVDCFSTCVATIAFDQEQCLSRGNHEAFVQNGGRYICDNVASIPTSALGQSLTAARLARVELASTDYERILNELRAGRTPDPFAQLFIERRGLIEPDFYSSFAVIEAFYTGVS